MKKRLVVFGIITFAILSLNRIWASEIKRDAKRHMYRGQAAMEEAKGPTDYQDAVNEFKRAIKYAPSWADAWFNLGVAQEKAEDYVGAIKSYKKYLELNPNASDFDKVEGRIYKLEYKAERQQKDISFIRNLVGRWAAASKSKKYTQYWVYNIKMKNENSLLIEFARKVEFDPPPSWLSSGYTTGSPHRAVIEVTLDNYQLNGTLTSWLVDDGVAKINPEYLTPKKYPVSGEISKDGRRITLKSTTSIPAMTYKSGNEYVTVLQKR